MIWSGCAMATRLYLAYMFHSLVPGWREGGVSEFTFTLTPAYVCVLDSVGLDH